MSKKGGGGRKSRRSGVGRGRGNDLSTAVERVSGRLFWNHTGLAFSAGGDAVQTYAIAPALGGQTGMLGGAKLTSLADIFQLYRFTKFKMRLLQANSYPSPAATATSHAALGARVDLDGPDPTTLNEALGYPVVTDVCWSQANAASSAPGVWHMPSVGGNWVSVPKKLLLDQPVKWWQTVASTQTPELIENQGQIVIAGLCNVASLTWRPNVEIRYTCEFKNFIANNLTRKNREDNSQLALKCRASAHESDDDISDEDIDQELIDEENKMIDDPAAKLMSYARKRTQQGSSFSPTSSEFVRIKKEVSAEKLNKAQSLSRAIGVSLSRALKVLDTEAALSAPPG